MDVFYILTVLWLLNSAAAYQISSRGYIMGRNRLPNRLRMSPEHLIDCATNSQIADLYGGGGSPICIQSNVGVFSGLRGLFDQAVTIGFLVMSYFFFKRSANGVVDWIDTEVDPDSDYIDIDVNQNPSPSGRRRGQDVRRRQDQDETEDGTRVCPQCVGTGYFSWEDGAEEECELCEGTGHIEQISWGGQRKANSFTLPPK